MATRPYDERLDLLLSTAARVFAEKGYHPTTMRDLSRETGMSLAGMYHYVQGKEELLFLIQRECFERVYRGAVEVTERVHDPVDRLQAFIRHHVVFFAEHMSEMKVLSHDADSLSGDRLTTITDLKRRYVSLLTRLITEVNPDHDPRLSAYALFGMMNWIYTWYHPSGHLAPEDLAARFGAIFLQGVQPDPARVS